MESNRLIIKEFEDRYLEQFKELIKDKMSSPVAIYDEQFRTDDEFLKMIFNYFKLNKEFFGIIKKEEDILIGFLSLNKKRDDKYNLGYTIHTKYQGYGYGYEATSKL